MPIPNVSTLFQRINKGSEGGHEFARIMGLLYNCEAKIDGFDYIQCSDASGDYKGVDAVLKKDGSVIGLQFKFISSKPNTQQTHQITKSLNTALAKFPEMTEWWLVVPEDFDKHRQEWVDGLEKKVTIKVKWVGHSKIIGLMLKYPHIGRPHYPELPYTKPYTEYIPSPEATNEYFNKFLDSTYEISALLLKAQPTISDCRAIFSGKYANEIYSFYSILYQNLAEINENQSSEKVWSNKTFELHKNSYTDIVNKADQLPGGMKKIIMEFDAINPETDFYIIRFKKEISDKSGFTMSIWCYLDGRWVHFPKPWRLIHKIEEIKNDKSIKRMIKFLRWSRIGKKNGNKTSVDDILIINHIVNKLLHP